LPFDFNRTMPHQMQHELFRFWGIYAVISFFACNWGIIAGGTWGRRAPKCMGSGQGVQ
jgi:hypothetical protein